jgi:hypothetical protein
VVVRQVIGQVRQRPRSLMCEDRCSTGGKCCGYQQLDQHQPTPLKALLRTGPGKSQARTKDIRGRWRKMAWVYYRQVRGDGLEQTGNISSIYTDETVCGMEAA